jgi:hypothetical protein
MAEKRSRTAAAGKRERLQDLGKSGTATVRQAASVLEEELAAGVAGVRKVEQRFTKERRVDQAEFSVVLDRFRANAHEFIDVAAGRVEDLRSDEVQELSHRLTQDAHDLFDSMINLVGLAPDVVNRLTTAADLVKGGQKAGSGRAAARSRRPARPGG